MQPGEGLTGHAASERAPIAIAADARDDPRFKALPAPRRGALRLAARRADRRPPQPPRGRDERAHGGTPRLAGRRDRAARDDRVPGRAGDRERAPLRARAPARRRAGGARAHLGGGHRLAVPGRGAREDRRVGCPGRARRVLRARAPAPARDRRRAPLDADGPRRRDAARRSDRRAARRARPARRAARLGRSPARRARLHPRGRRRFGSDVRALLALRRRARPRQRSSRAAASCARSSHRRSTTASRTTCRRWPRSCACGRRAATRPAPSPTPSTASSRSRRCTTC